MPADGANAAPPAGGAAAVDDAGRLVRLDSPARRVVSLVPSATDVVLALGLEDRLIARTEFDVDPRLASLPSVGQGLTPNVEWLAARSPDLVIAWRDVEGRALVERLGDVDIPVYAARIEDIPTALSTISRIGVLLGRPAAADSLRAALEARIDSVRAAAAAEPRPSVLYLAGGDPPWVPGPGTFVDQLIEVAGGRNVFGDLAEGWHSVSVEEIVRRDPDVVVVPTHTGTGGTAEALARRPGWRDLSAVREGRVHAVDGEAFGRPGPRLAEAAAALAELLR